jgi:DNA-binding NarL/FixJ family response regulator
LDAIPVMTRERPGVAVLVLSLSDDERVVARAVAAGVRGYVLKDAPPHTVLDALRTVAEGGMVFGPRIVPPGLAGATGGDVGAGGSSRRTRLPPPFDRLTARELQVLEGVVAGRTTDRIARELGLSPKTVRNQVSVVLGKLGVGGRVQAALLARDAGVVPPR